MRHPHTSSTDHIRVSRVWFLASQTPFQSLRTIFQFYLKGSDYSLLFNDTKDFDKLSFELTSKIVHFNLFGGKIWFKISVLTMFTNIHLPAIIWLYKIALLVISSLPRFRGVYYMGWWLWGIGLNEIPTTRALVETAAPMINFSLFPRGKLVMALHILGK